MPCFWELQVQTFDIQHHEHGNWKAWSANVVCSKFVPELAHQRLESFVIILDNHIFKPVHVPIKIKWLESSVGNIVYTWWIYISSSNFIASSDFGSVTLTFCLFCAALLHGWLRDLCDTSSFLSSSFWSILNATLIHFVLLVPFVSNWLVPHVLVLKMDKWMVTNLFQNHPDNIILWRHTFF
jgi:hypothetical protein